MKLQKLYEMIVQEGIARDPRGKKRIKEVLAQEKNKFEKLESDEKLYFDEERLINPFADTRILIGDKNTHVKSAIVGIDMEVAEVLLADRLREKGTKIDLIITHHPEGFAYARFYGVMSLQADVFAKCGIPIAVAENLTKERMGEVSRSVASANHMQVTDAAKLLGIPYMCAHTVADNQVTDYLQKICDRKKPTCLKDVLDILFAEPEYQEARRNNAGPFILNGSAESRAGKILIDMTGGTEGSREIFSRLAANGISTIVCMHLSEAHLKKAKEQKLNVINAGHIASDNVGLNLLFDAVTKKEKINFIEASGFRRVTRTK